MNDERLRAVLPLLRPRTEEPTTLVLLVFAVLCIGIISLFALYLWRKRSRRLQLEARFVMLGAEKGLNETQILYLIQLAWQKRMKNPQLLLNSPYAFDRIAGSRAGELVDAPDQSELMEIGEIRSNLGFDRLPTDQPLRTTRQLETGLTIMVWQEADEDFYPWILVGRDERQLTIVPLFRQDYDRFLGLEPGELLLARIWREEDTEYRFSSEILEIDSASLVTNLRHAESLERLQQRDFYRLNIQFDIAFILRGATTAADDQEQRQDEFADQVITGHVLNLSAGGLCAIVDQPVPTAYMLQIDSSCTQPFPLAGICCEVMQGTAVDSTDPLLLRFDQLAPERERELVRRIYHYQINGREPADD